jgi:hypothetical protein
MRGESKARHLDAVWIGEKWVDPEGVPEKKMVDG